MMRKKLLYLISVFVLSLAYTTCVSAGIVYVDATDGEAGNTILASGEVFAPVDVGSSGSGADGLWRIRGGFSNGGTIYETRGDWAGNNTEDCPRLMTSVDVPEGDYEVYAYMWTAGTAQWRIRASLTDDANELPLYLCYDPNGASTLAVAEDFEEPVPLVTEDDRTLWQVYLGTTGTTTAITVYIDDDADSDPADGGNSRTWYDGIGYKPAPPKIIYVDATDASDPNVAANTTLATGEVFAADDPGTTGSGADGLWRKRAFSNGGTIFEAGGDWGGNNSEDCPRLMTSVDVPEGNYDVYAYMITAGDAQWLMGASLEDGEGELPLYLCNDPNGAATLAVAEDFEEPVPMLTEDNRTLWQIYLGTTGTTTAINVYIDDYADRDPTNGGNLRTWYDGIGYKVATPEPEGPSMEGLVAYYAMEGDALDSSGNVLDGIMMGDPTFAAGPVGMAMDFDGDGDYVDCGNPDGAFDITGQLTVATWVNIRSLPQAWSPAVVKGEDAWRFSTNSSLTSFHFGINYWQTTNYGVNGSTEVGMDEWHHLCGTYDGATITFYLDGVVDGTIANDVGIGISTDPLRIGANITYEDRFWDGLIDEVMVFDRALSTDEVAALSGL